MVSRWAYEALSVTQFKNNEYEKLFYQFDKLESLADYKQVYFIPELQKILGESENLLKQANGSSELIMDQKLVLLKNEFLNDSEAFNDIPCEFIDQLTVRDFNNNIASQAMNYLEDLNEKYVSLFNLVSKRRNDYIILLQEEYGGEESFRSKYNDYHNEFLEDLLTKTTVSEKIARGEDKLIQIIDPVYLYPSSDSYISFRAHFYAPVKYLFGVQMETIYFNLIIIWLFSVLLYVTLYYDVLKKLLGISAKKVFRLKKNRSLASGLI